MGTRADFYVGIDENAEWLGSIAWDGYPDGIPDGILLATTKKVFKKEVLSFLKDREDSTLPEEGWPWPWDDSNTTDYAYGIYRGEVLSNAFGHGWQSKKLRDDYDEAISVWADNNYQGEEPVDSYLIESNFPDMSSVMNVTMDPKRSGILLFTG